MLMRFDPFRDLDRLAQATWSDSGRTSRTSPMAMDAYRTEDRVVVELDLPGVDPASVELTIDDRVLTVSAERRFERGEVEVLAAERRHGSFTRQLSLGEGLDPDGVRADYDRGVLTVTIPVAEKARPRRVQITTSGTPEAIETSATEA